MGLEISRKNMFQIFREAENLGPYAEFPMLRPEVDPQVHFSYNDRDQPFYLVCEKDTVLAQISGSASVEFRNTSVSTFSMSPGDHIYVPGCIPHKIRIETKSLHARYKAKEAGLEGTVWYCENCGNVLYRQVWDTAVHLSQEGYLQASQNYNARITRRCTACGKHHPEIDFVPFRWNAYAELIRTAATEAAPQSKSATG